MSTFDETSVKRDDDGKFAARPTAAEVDVDLVEHVAQAATDADDAAPMSPLAPSELRHSPRRGGEQVVSDSTRTFRGAGPNGFAHVEFHVGGEPHRRVANTAAAAVYRDVAGNEARVERLVADGKPVTLLAISKTGTVKTLEGRCHTTTSGRQALLPKGAKSRGYYLDSIDVVDARPGYGGADELDESWRTRMSRHMPATSKITDFDDVPDVGEGETPDSFSAAYLTEHPGFGGGPHPGCIFLATDRQSGGGGERGDIVNGYFWAPGDSGGELTSERSSMYSTDLQRTGAKVDDFDPAAVRPADCWKTMPPSRTEAYRQIVGRPFYDE